MSRKTSLMLKFNLLSPFFKRGFFIFRELFLSIIFCLLLSLKTPSFASFLFFQE